ncbi:MAG: hypothetical protein IKO19_11800 [Candidatus Riflebacteria bacterium]|nr:hypothetical protein [Candidatus Riflebacteria bacterium]
MYKQRRFIKLMGCLCLFLFCFSFCSNIFADLNNQTLKTESICEKQDDVGGSGVYPYNYRLIDNCLAAGGSLFNPVSKNNSDEKVCEYIRLLKNNGISSLMLLHVPLKDTLTPRLEQCCQKEGMKLIKMRMNAEQLPTEEQTKYLMDAIASGSYVHCMWGCDRTGAIIGKYLRTKGYSGKEALEAVVNKGTHAGKLGGFKRKSGNKNLLLYFWPEVESEAPEIYEEFSK